HALVAPGRAGAPVGGGRAAAQGADPPQRPGRAGPRAAAVVRRVLGAAGTPRLVRGAAAVAGHGRGRAGPGLAGPRRPAALAARRTDGSVGVRRSSARRLPLVVVVEALDVALVERAERD